MTQHTPPLPSHSSSSSDTSSPSPLPKLDIDTLKKILKNEKISEMHIRPIKPTDFPFKCHVTEKMITLTIKTTVKKTTFQLTLDPTSLTENDRPASKEGYQNFIKKFNEIARLIDQKKVACFGSDK